MDAAVQVEELHKRYGPVRAVDGVSFEVRSGEIFGLLGPNGAGKTTLLELLEGLRRPDRGRIRVLGVDVLARPGELRPRVGIQLQEGGFFDLLTVRETVELFAALYPSARPVGEVLGELGLEGRAHARVAQLSGGQRQRLALAVALVHGPRLLFLDEPTSGLDPQARRSLWELLRRLRQEGRTVMLSTHYMEEAEALCDRVAILDQGRILALDTPRRLVRELGGASTIEFASSVALERERLQGLGGVREVSSRDGRWLLFTDRAQETLLELARLAELRELVLRQPTLEDVFLKLTGRALRD